MEDDDGASTSVWSKRLGWSLQRLKPSLLNELPLSGIYEFFNIDVDLLINSTQWVWADITQIQPKMSKMQMKNN